MQSSPVLPTMIRSSEGRSRASPRRNRAAPVPPASATTFTATRSASPTPRARRRRSAPGRAPYGGASAPGEQAQSGHPAQSARQRDLGDGDEAEPNPHGVEPLRAGEERVDAPPGRRGDGFLDELGGHLEGIARRGAGC